MKNLKQLEKERAIIQGKINKIENEEYKKIQLPFLKSLVGKCFVYRNNSCGGDTPRWDVFKKVLELLETKNGSPVFICKEFEIKGDEYVEIRITSDYTYTHKNWFGVIPFSGYVECSEEEFEREYLKTLNELTSYNKLKKSILKQ